MIYVFLIINSWLKGQIDAFLYSRKGAEALPDNEHKWLVRDRAMSVMLGLSGIWYGFLFGAVAFVVVAVEVIAWVFAFSVWHNAAYYLMRDRIDKTTHGHKYQSPTDSSKINFNYVRRRNMFYISLGVLVVGYALIYLLFN